MTSITFLFITLVVFLVVLIMVVHFIRWLNAHKIIPLLRRYDISYMNEERPYEELE